MTEKDLKKYQKDLKKLKPKNVTKEDINHFTKPLKEFYKDDPEKLKEIDEKSLYFDPINGIHYVVETLKELADWFKRALQLFAENHKPKPKDNSKKKGNSKASVKEHYHYSNENSPEQRKREKKQRQIAASRINESKTRSEDEKLRRYNQRVATRGKESASAGFESTKSTQRGLAK